jgi:hypothetical protein
MFSFFTSTAKYKITEFSYYINATLVVQLVRFVIEVVLDHFSGTLPDILLRPIMRKRHLTIDAQKLCF